MGTLIVFGIFIVMSFTIGIYLGQKLSKNESVEINPIRIVDEYKDERKAKREIQEQQSKFDIMLENIDNYDGTGIGQKDLR